MESHSSNEQGGSAERITPRYVFEKRIRICVQRASQNLVMEGWTRDISETGLCAFVAQELIAGEAVMLDIPILPSRRLGIPAKIANCMGTQYGFQFTALSAQQRADIRFGLRNCPEIGAHDRLAGAKVPAIRRVLERQETAENAEVAFADRARELVKRGYTPKVAVELVLHEVETEHSHDPRIKEKARADAEDFLLKARRGLI